MPCSGPTAPASRPWSRSSPACSTTTAARSPSTARRCGWTARPRPGPGGWPRAAQAPALIRYLTVNKTLRLTGVDPADVRRELAAMDLDGLDLGEQVRDIPLPFLRMLDLARALVFDPQLLMLDEITAALPPDLSERVFAIMGRWKQRNRSVLFISHRLAEVREHCDMCTVLRDGRDVASFHPGEGGEAQIGAAMLGEASAGVRGGGRGRGRGTEVGPGAGRGGGPPPGRPRPAHRPPGRRRLLRGQCRRGPGP